MGNDKLQTESLWRRLKTELHWIEEHGYSVKHHLESGNEKRVKQEMVNLFDAITSAKDFVAKIERITNE